MHSVNVKEILESVLIESNSTRYELVDASTKRIIKAISDAHDLDPVPEVGSTLIPHLAHQLVEREMAIYENVEKTLQRVIDELQSSSR